MAVYRVQVVHASYWRGAPKRWNNTFHYLVGTGAVDFAGIVAAMHTILNGLGASTYHGGVAEIKVYSASGGTPVYSNTYFDWTTPSSWLPYTGSAIWPAGVASGAGEAAALFEVPAGSSSSGKPVTTKSYWHAFTQSPTPESGAVDFSPAAITNATTQYNKLLSVPGTSGPAFIMCAPDGSPIGTASTLRAYIVAHQRVRGRRRRALVTADGKYTGPTVEVPPTSIIAG